MLRDDAAPPAAVAGRARQAAGRQVMLLSCFARAMIDEASTAYTP